MKPTSAFSLVRFEGKILIIKDRRGRWTLPGGQIDKGEKEEKAAERETFEETSLKVSIKKKSSKKTKKYSNGKKKAVIFKSKTKKKKVTLSVEHIEFAWVSFSMAREMLIKRHAVALVHLFSNKKNGEKIK